jgi:hypothetical protein
VRPARSGPRQTGGGGGPCPRRARPPPVRPQSRGKVPRLSHVHEPPLAFQGVQCRSASRHERARDDGGGSHCIFGIQRVARPVTCVSFANKLPGERTVAAVPVWRDAHANVWASSVLLHAQPDTNFAPEEKSEALARTSRQGVRKLRSFCASLETRCVVHPLGLASDPPPAFAENFL